mmetsp:Transcript_15196/g.28913  ORF Transcript_15196/g.28913 Transcript_15196/m.28913 type:complete len:244 (-) Transcript_15196:267-998(-)|eukprot:CAMPEP_0170168004 /NCGR_PEP_ID=MMETSP0040_2-20121228/1214_1 /TAXON_ID=641309 /ORGANISM="Lotharella oceanica, Strain CCMP622" /LENGTH=243 /DNA_ID=CAMNT_0010406161 /DNA_START=56 /DNA_END=787 /DNA_ORIENTATION=+
MEEIPDSNEELFRNLLAMDSPAPTPENMLITRGNVAGAKRNLHSEMTLATTKRQKTDTKLQIDEGNESEDSDDEYDSKIEKKTSELESMVEELSAQNDNLEARIHALEREQRELKSQRRRVHFKARRRHSGRRSGVCHASKPMNSDAFLQIWLVLSALGGVGSQIKTKLATFSKSKGLNIPRAIGVDSLQQSAPVTCGDSPMELRRQLLVALATCSARMTWDMAETMRRVRGKRWSKNGESGA